MASSKMKCEVCGKECESGYVLDGHMRHDHDGIGHQHKYIVPVEWRTKEHGAGDPFSTKTASIGEGFVTKLRCESCPDEISREDK